MRSTPVSAPSPWPQAGFGHFCTPAGDLLRRGAADRRRVTGRRIARLLLPIAEAAGGFTSTELLVRAPDEAVMWQPDVALVIGEAPADGQLREPPALVAVVDVGDATPILDVQQWLRLGVAVVWHVHEESVDVWTRS